MNLVEINETYNSIVREFHISTSVLREMKEVIEALAICRINICALLKISKFDSESLDLKEEELKLTISKNKCNIKHCEEEQIELKQRIEANKLEIRAIRIQINVLEDKLLSEQQESRKLREALGIFLSRDKFKIIKQIFLSRYRRVFFKYSHESIIKTKIMESNITKGIMRHEKQSLHNAINGYTRKIAMDKRSIAQIRKSIINIQKCIDFSNVKLLGIEDYKEMEKKFRVQITEVTRIK